MLNQKRRKNVRNVAIIAHVNHGKTTLIDALLKQTGAYKFKDGETTIMDSNPLEKERGMTILHRVLPPVADSTKPFQMLITMLEYDSYVGGISIGRIFHGKIRNGEQMALVKTDGTIKEGKVTKILKYKGLKRVEVDSAEAGDAEQELYIRTFTSIRNTRVKSLIASQACKSQ